jgi:DNA-binding response OmpR family regulator
MTNVDTPICIIEDNKSIRKLFCTLLQKSGNKTVDFGDGNSGLSWLNENTPLALIVDILLPDQSGTDILQLVREMPHGERIPIIAVTGFAHAYDRNKFLELGFDGYIPKPVNTSSFVNEVKEIIVQKGE